MIEQASLVLGNGNWAVKSDSLLGYKTIDGEYYPREFTFTRATTGTRVNEAGLVEVVPYNLLSWSEEFDNAYWNKVRSTVTANTTTAPNGTLTAEYMQQVSGQTTGGGIYVVQTYVVGQTYTLSVYAKKKENSILRPGFAIGPGALALFGQFDLENGVTLTPSAGITQAIENIGNGWYRCSITATSQVSGSYLTFIYQSSTINSNDTTPLTGIYIWGAQLVEGTEPLDYLPTTDRLDIPRIDYSTGEPALLLEPQRTNLAVYSSSFDNAAWVKIIGGTSTLPVVTANYADSPDGTQNADRIQCSADTSSASNYSLVGTTGLTLSATGTFTIYLKSNTSSNQNVLIYWTVGQGQVFNVTPEWQRFTLSNLTAATAAIRFGTRGGSGSFLNGGDASIDILAYGAQIELGSYSTSYIPTTSASVTRNQDVCSKTGATDLIGQTEGTMFLDFVKNNNDIGVIQISDGTTSNRIYIGISNTNIIAQVRSGGGTAQAFFTVAATNNTRYKCAIAYKANDFVLYINGNQEGIDTSGLVPVSFSQFQTSDIGGAIFVNPINSTALWKERLSDSELATLTTL